MKLTFETSRMKNIIVKKLTKSSKFEAGSAAEVGAPIENKVIATYTAKKENNNGEEEETEEEK